MFERFLGTGLGALLLGAVLGCGGGAHTDRCTPEADHAVARCSGDAVYWYDSCGNKRERVAECGATATCVDAACVEDADVVALCAAQATCEACARTFPCGRCGEACVPGSFSGPDVGDCDDWTWGIAACQGGSSGCGAPGLAAGDAEHTTSFGGLDRTYLVHVPPVHDGETPLPLVLNFHGFGMTANDQASSTGMRAKADAAGFVAVHPQGFERSWNVESCCGEAQARHLDDVGFVRQLVSEVAATACIDRRRIYATGFSNGGFMSHRLGCEASDIIAGIAPVSGVLGMSDEACSPVRPLSVLHMHGTADVVVPYKGGIGFLPFQTVGPFRSPADVMAGWASRNGCSSGPRRVFESGAEHWEAWDGCRKDVSVVLVTNAQGHEWLGGLAGGARGATDLAWDFFSGVVP